MITLPHQKQLQEVLIGAKYKHFDSHCTYIIVSMDDATTGYVTVLNSRYEERYIEGYRFRRQYELVAMPEEVKGELLAHNIGIL